MNTSSVVSSVPLVVDLDGTLVATDTFWESLVKLAKTKPHLLALLPIWMLGGKANVKAMLARHAPLSADTLPYRPEVIEYLQAEKQSGRTLILASGSHSDLVGRVADRLGLFSKVLATSGQTNLTGTRKLRAIHAALDNGEFDYLGDSRQDLPVWKGARKSLVVAPTRGLLASARRVGTVDRIIGGRRNIPLSLLKACRPHQWTKNVLVFVPLILAYRLWDLPIVMQTLLVFVCFGLAASGVYLVNDLLDLAADRAHPRKCKRPFASGALPLPYGIAGAPLLFAGSTLLASGLLNTRTLATLIVYLVVTFGYSLYLKHRLLLDVIALAMLYTLRILAGGSVEIPGIDPATCLQGFSVSKWLLTFSVFFFLSLAFIKRYTELLTLRDAGMPADAGSTKLHGRNYYIGDLATVRTLGLITGTMAVLVAALYIEDQYVRNVYPHPDFLWLVLPVLLYWIWRLWFLAERRHLPHDPVVFALEDRHSYLAGLVAAIVLMLARWGG